MIDYEKIIDVLKSDVYYTLKSDIVKLINDDNFMEKIIKVHNPLVFDRFIKMCEFKIDTLNIHEKRRGFIINSINRLDENNVYDFFDLDTLEKSQKEVVADRYLTEYIIDYYFGDNYYNYMTNVYEMINYLGRIKKILIDSEHLKIYKEFSSLVTATFDDKISIFKKYIDNSFSEMLYEDIRIVRNYSYNELVKCSIKLNHKSKIYSQEMSDEKGIDIYYLNGEEFHAFVKCFSINRNDLSNHYDYLLSNDRRLGYSFSYISDKNIGTVDYEQKRVVLLYDNIDYNKIMYVYHGDLHAKKLEKQDDFLSEKHNKLYTPDSLMAYTRNYNEIYIVDKPKPKALICYDTVTEDDILFAKEYKLAILILNRNKYKRYETYDDDYMTDTYVL